MIAGQQYDIVLSYEEVVELDEYLLTIDKTLKDVTANAAYAASAHGITIRFYDKTKRDELVDLVLTATDDDDEED